jgi:hypothetical protein
MPTLSPRVCATIAAALMTCALPAMADERRDWIEGLKQPGTGNSCCDIADCRRTEAYWSDGQWWARVWGRWSPIPPETLLRNQPSIDGEAYVCASWSSGVLCFVPPKLLM